MKTRKIIAVVSEVQFKLLQLALKDLPIVLVHETNVKIVLEIMRSTKFNLLISDISLGVISSGNPDGMEFIRMVKKGTKKIKTLALTAQNCKTEALEAGFDFFLEAPAKPSTIKGLIKEILCQRILFISANPFNARLISSDLDKNLYQVEIEESTKEALALLSEDSFDIVIIDLFLPAPGRNNEMRSWPLIHKIRNDHPGLRIIPISESLFPPMDKVSQEHSQQFGLKIIFDIDAAKLKAAL